MTKTIHRLLVQNQTTSELRRKAQKARRRGYMTTQEDIDLANRQTGFIWAAVLESFKDTPFSTETLDISLHTSASDR